MNTHAPYGPAPLWCSVTGFEDYVTPEGHCPLCKQDIMDDSLEAYFDHIVKGQA